MRLHSCPLQGILRRKEKLKAAVDSLSSSYLLNSDGAKQQLMGTMMSTPHKNKAIGPLGIGRKGRSPIEEQRGCMSFHASRHSLETGDAAVPTPSPIML